MYTYVHILNIYIMNYNVMKSVERMCLCVLIYYIYIFTGIYIHGCLLKKYFTHDLGDE